jgi:hypothetical protein
VQGLHAIVCVNVETELDFDYRILPSKHHNHSRRSCDLSLPRVKAHVRPHHTGPARAH